MVNDARRRTMGYTEFTIKMDVLMILIDNQFDSLFFKKKVSGLFFAPVDLDGGHLGFRIDPCSTALHLLL